MIYKEKVALLESKDFHGLHGLEKYFTWSLTYGILTGIMDKTCSNTF
jgi:hypothetical protein